MTSSQATLRRLVGRTLGHYRVIEAVGAGGMGEVYRARDEHLARDVAIKVLPTGEVPDEAARSQLRKEALALSRLNHPNIATVFDFDTQDGVDFLVMEFVSGAPVSGRLDRGPLAEADALDLAAQLAEGLAAAHEAGVVHGDLKPANLRLTESGRLKILDFGLAALTQAAGDAESTKVVTDAGAIAGTLPYMAPEQLEGARPSARTDLYAVGVILYEMVTGRRPFRSASPAALVGEILRGASPSARSIAPGITPGLDAIIARCLEKQPGARYGSASALLDDLRRQGTGTRPTAAIAQRRRARRRLAFLVGGAVVAVLVGYAGWMSMREPTLAFSNRDWLLIGDFENLTGDAVFDQSLQTALRVSIEQSSYVNVVPKRKIVEALRLMKKPPNARIDGPLGRELAEREGYRALLLPGIAGVGGAYVLSATLENPKTSVAVTSKVVQAPAKTDVVRAVDELARQIRRTLGESMAAIDRQGKPLARVTTPSLDALKLYSLAVDRHRDGQFNEAETYYESALKIDPAFTAARASLGMIRFEHGDRQAGQALLAEAIRHIDNVTDRERFGILSFHARAVENDVPKAAQYLKSLLGLYPDQAGTHNNLAVLYRQLKQYDAAATEYREALRVDPRLMLVHDGLAGLYLYTTGNLKAGLAACQAALAVDGQRAKTWDCLGWAYLGMGDVNQSLASFEKAVALDPREVNPWYRIGHIHRLRGQFAAALSAFEHVIDSDPSESAAHYDMGVTGRQMNDEKRATREFAAYRDAMETDVRATPNDAANLMALATVSLRLGEAERANVLLKRSLAIDRSQEFGLACFLSVQGKKQEALGQLELAVEKGFTNYIWLTIHADLDHVRTEPRFQALLARHLKQ